MLKSLCSSRAPMKRNSSSDVFGKRDRRNYRSYILAAIQLRPIYPAPTHGSEVAGFYYASPRRKSFGGLRVSSAITALGRFRRYAEHRGTPAGAHMRQPPSLMRLIIDETRYVWPVL